MPQELQDRYIITETPHAVATAQNFPEIALPRIARLYPLCWLAPLPTEYHLKLTD